MIAEKIKDGALIVALERTGFEMCEFGPDEHPCENCNEKNKQLYFGDRDYWDSREGKYLCADCVIKRFIANEQAIAES